MARRMSKTRFVVDTNVRPKCERYLSPREFAQAARIEPR